MPKAITDYSFLINPNYWDRTVDVPLDHRLGFTSSEGSCEIAEIYPRECLRLTSQVRGQRLVPI